MASETQTGKNDLYIYFVKSLLRTTGGLTKQPVWLLLQVKRDTLQATKYVELLLVADYAEVRNGIFVPREHWASHLQHPWGREGCWGSASFLLQSQWFSADRESCVLVTFVLAATTAQGEMQIWMRAEGQSWFPRVAVVSLSYGWEILPSD